MFWLESIFYACVGIKWYFLQLFVFCCLFEYDKNNNVMKILTHLGLMMHGCFCKLGNHRFWVMACRLLDPNSHYKTICTNAGLLSIGSYGTNISHCFFSCDQAALWMVFSVCLSVCPSVCLSVTPFWLCSHHRIIMKFSGVITNDKSDVHAKGQGQRSKVKVTEVNTQLNRFRTVTPVWIHIWWWNDAYSLMTLRRGALLFLKVICQISRSHGSKKRQIWPRLGVSGL